MVEEGRYESRQWGGDGKPYLRLDQGHWNSIVARGRTAVAEEFELWPARWRAAETN
jgi:hypothetical protein